MSRTLFSVLMMAGLAALLGGCGVTQAVGDGTASTARAIFAPQVKALHLDLRAQAAINLAGSDMNSLSVPTQVRVYQLKDRAALEKASYDGIELNAQQLLGADLLAEHSLVVKPGQGAQLNVPLEKDAQFVAVVALLRDPDPHLTSWRLTLRRDQLSPKQPRVVELAENRLTLRPLGQE